MKRNINDETQSQKNQNGWDQAETYNIHVFVYCTAYTKHICFIQAYKENTS